MKRPERRTSNDLLVTLIASGSTLAEAARASGVSVATVTRRLHDPDFVSRVREMRSQATSRAIGRLSDIAGKAAEKLIELLDCRNQRIEIRAAKAILDTLVKLRESQDLESRVIELEQRLKAMGVESK